MPSDVQSPPSPKGVDCFKLAMNAKAADIPAECLSMLDNPDVLKSRTENVRIQRTLSLKSATDIHTQYRQHHPPQVQDKIRKLRTRMSMKGALNMPDVDPEDVRRERELELARKESRREERKTKVY